MKTKKLNSILRNLFAMGVLIFLLIMGVMYWLSKYTRQGEVTIVPDIKEMTLADAQTRLRLAGLECVVADSDYVKKQFPGSVLEYNPSVGQKVKKGRTIFVIVNKQSAPQYPIPDVADNSSVRQAEAKILAAGFKLTEHEFIAGEADWVYDVKYKGQSLVAGDKIPMEATLTLVVGNGQTKEHNTEEPVENNLSTEDNEDVELQD
ncbi:Serine/threonine-protein kinase PK-1 [termite gut metagenome]|uniref:Serine/threonine-protein kinase PK-1 n=1 Tax=termite gut metagenome TaxID=433724 RepID=A0A5J4SC61_9ZZZZ